MADNKKMSFYKRYINSKNLEAELLTIIADLFREEVAFEFDLKNGKLNQDDYNEFKKMKRIINSIFIKKIFHLHLIKDNSKIPYKKLFDHYYENENNTDYLTFFEEKIPPNMGMLLLLNQFLKKNYMKFIIDTTLLWYPIQNFPESTLSRISGGTLQSFMELEISNRLDLNKFFVNYKTELRRISKYFTRYYKNFFNELNVTLVNYYDKISVDTLLNQFLFIIHDRSRNPQDNLKDMQFYHFYKFYKFNIISFIYENLFNFKEQSKEDFTKEVVKWYKSQLERVEELTFKLLYVTNVFLFFDILIIIFSISELITEFNPDTKDEIDKIFVDTIFKMNIESSAFITTLMLCNNNAQIKKNAFEFNLLFKLFWLYYEYYFNDHYRNLFVKCLADSWNKAPLIKSRIKLRMLNDLKHGKYTLGKNVGMYGFQHQGQKKFYDDLMKNGTLFKKSIRSIIFENTFRIDEEDEN